MRRASAFGLLVILSLAAGVVTTLASAQQPLRRATVPGLAADSAAPAASSTATATATVSPAPTKPPSATPTSPGGDVGADVVISGFAFLPRSVTITKGQSVKWTHQDGNVSHGVTIPGVFQSPVGIGGLSFSFTFSDEGTFAYRCSVHASMTGEVVVVDDSGGVES